MRKYLLGILVVFAIFAPSTKAAETVFGFLDGKFYDSTATLRYQCFMDGNCYDLEGKPAPFKMTPVIQPTLPANNTATPEQPTSPPANPTPATSTTEVATRVTKADKVKAEIFAYIDKLNAQLAYTDSTVVPDTWTVNGMLTTENCKNCSILYQSGAMKSYTREQLQKASPFMADFYKRRDSADATIKRLMTIKFEVDDYASAGIIPSAEERVYLLSLGINW